MGNETPASCSMNPPQSASNYDEIFMQQRLHFADRLKDLKNLRKQLYSAAEYFEVSYDKDDHKQFVVETSKDYVTKALISTVDHLGSVADKLGQFLDEKTNEFSETKLRFSCIEQRLKTYQGFINLSGLSQQSLIIETPKHHKQYIIPGAILHSGKSKSMYRNCISCPGDDLHQPKQDNSFAKAFQTSKLKSHPPFSRKGHSRQPSSEFSPSSLTFSFTRNLSIKTGKRSISPLRFSIKRSGSITNRSRSPSSMSNKQQCPSEPRRAISMSTKPEINRGREIDQYKKKSNNLFKALLSIHRSRKESIPNKCSDNRIMYIAISLEQYESNSLRFSTDAMKHNNTGVHPLESHVDVLRGH
ncbi:Protein ABIL2 [Forsythia ovata]|uniref:Protein ABIL2 n=1 Tax=Forsythia ovata TaxID=205694 RepID=A0ABD1W2A2_9LAMI